MFKNVGANWLQLLVSVAVTFVLTPFLIRTLGTDGHGTWTLVVSLVGYLTLLALGVPMASVRYFAEHVAKEEQEELQDAVSACAGLYTLLGGVALALGGVLYLVFSIVYVESGAVPAHLATPARIALGLFVLQIALGFFTQLPYGLLAAGHRFVPRCVIVSVSQLVKLALIVGLLSWNKSLPLLAAIHVGLMLLEFVAATLIVKRFHPDVRFLPDGLEWGVIRRIATFSLFAMLLNVGIRLSFQSDALVIGRFVDVGENPYYSVANSLVVYLTELLVGIGAVVMPLAIALRAKQDETALRNVFLKWSKVAFSLSLLACVGIHALGESFIAFWMDDPVFAGRAAPVLQTLIYSCVVFLPARGVALPTLMGIGDARVPAFGFLVAGVANVVVSVMLAKAGYGILGVAFGTALPNIAFGLLLLDRALREVGLSGRAYFAYVLPRAVLGVVPVWLALLVVQELEPAGMLELLAYGGLSLLVAAVSAVLIVFRGDPYFDPSVWIGARVRAWRTA